MLSYLNYTLSKSNNSDTIEYAFIMTHSDTNLFPLDMCQIARQQDNNEELLKRMSDKHSK